MSVRCQGPASLEVPSDNPVDSPRLGNLALASQVRSSDKVADLPKKAPLSSMSTLMLESKLDLLIEQTRRDIFAHLQMTLESQMGFCESSLHSLKIDLQGRTISLPVDFSLGLTEPGDDKGGREGGGGRGSSEKRPVEEQDSEGGRGATLRTSKFISRAAGEKQRQNLSPFKRMISSPQFDAAVALLILSNCVFMGFQVENDDKAAGVIVLQIVFCVLFTIELTTRFAADFRRFFQKDVVWNIFDSVTVFGSIIELVIKFSLPNRQDSSSGQFLVLRCLRFLRFLRVARMLRVKAFRELRLMVQSMLCCLKPLTWTVLLLVMVIYIFSIVFAQATNDAKKEGKIQAKYASALEEHFLTMYDSMFTLLSFILGGTDWLQYAIALGSLSPVYKLLLCGYVIFTQLALLNVVTAIFVDSSMNAAMNDKQLVIQDEMVREGLNKTELEKLFDEASEGNSTLSVKKLRQYLEDEQAKTYLKILDVHYREPNELVRVLDANHDGAIDAQEFVKGCLKLKSQRMVDVYSAVLEIRPALSFLKNTLSAIRQKLEVLDKKECEEGDLPAPDGHDNNQIQCDLQASVLELQTAAHSFKNASTQLLDSHVTLENMYSSFGDMQSSLQSTSASIDEVSAKLQDRVTSMYDVPFADQSSRWQHDLQTNQVKMIQQLDIILQSAKEKEHEGWGPGQKSCTGTTEEPTEAESCQTLPSPEVTSVSAIDHIFNPSGTDRGLPSSTPRASDGFNTSRLKMAARLGPSFSPHSGTLTVQRGDQDPVPAQPCTELESSVTQQPLEARHCKPSRSCCHDKSESDSFMCLHR